MFRTEDFLDRHLERHHSNYTADPPSPASALGLVSSILYASSPAPSILPLASGTNASMVCLADQCPELHCGWFGPRLPSGRRKRGRGRSSAAPVGSMAAPCVPHLAAQLRQRCEALARTCFAGPAFPAEDSVRSPGKSIQKRWA